MSSTYSKMVFAQRWDCPSRHCRRQCKIFASGVNFSIFTNFLCFFLLKPLKLGEIYCVKFFSWKSDRVKFLINSMSDWRHIDVDKTTNGCVWIELMQQYDSWGEVFQLGEISRSSHEWFFRQLLFIWSGDVDLVSATRGDSQAYKLLRFLVFSILCWVCPLLSSSFAHFSTNYWMRIIACSKIILQIFLTIHHRDTRARLSHRLIYQYFQGSINISPCRILSGKKM